NDLARRLIEPARERRAQLARRIGEAVQHPDEKRPRDAQHGRGLERRGGRRTPGLGEERDLSQKRAWADREVLAVLRRREAESALLDDEDPLRLVGGAEEHLPAIEAAALRRDRRHARCQ